MFFDSVFDFKLEACTKQIEARLVSGARRCNHIILIFYFYTTSIGFWYDSESFPRLPSVSVNGFTALLLHVYRRCES